MLDAIRTTYERIWRKAEKMDAILFYVRNFTHRSDGMFYAPDPSSKRRPSIAIHRGRSVPCWSVDIDQPYIGDDHPYPEDELFTLAHEVGHLRSWSWDPLRFAHTVESRKAHMRGESNAVQRAAVFLEEARAWEFAYEELTRADSPYALDRPLFRSAVYGSMSSYASALDLHDDEVAFAVPWIEKL